MVENTITVNETTIEALDDGKVLLNGEPIKAIADFEIIFNTLIKAVISIVK